MLAARNWPSWHPGHRDDRDQRVCAARGGTGRAARPGPWREPSSRTPRAALSSTAERVGAGQHRELEEAERRRAHQQRAQAGQNPAQPSKPPPGPSRGTPRRTRIRSRPPEPGHRGPELDRFMGQVVAPARCGGRETPSGKSRGDQCARQPAGSAQGHGEPGEDQGRDGSRYGSSGPGRRGAPAHHCAY